MKLLLYSNSKKTYNKDSFIEFLTFAFHYFQGGPYHDLLHSLLGAYACYRPDVGYVSTCVPQKIMALFPVSLYITCTKIQFVELLNSNYPCTTATEENYM